MPPCLTRTEQLPDLDRGRRVACLLTVEQPLPQAFHTATAAVIMEASPPKRCVAALGLRRLQILSRW